MLRQHHHCTLRATNNRYGQYGLRGIDIYFNGRYLAEKLVRENTKIATAEIVKIIDDVEAQISESSTLQPIVQRLRSQIDRDYEAIAIELSTEIETTLTERIFAPQDYADCIFWQNVIDRWGQGSGYKVDVLLLYTQQLGSIDRDFANLLQLAWRERFIDPILTFLGESNKQHPQ